MKHCPAHVEHLIVDANSRFPVVSDAHHHYFQLRCPCGWTAFRLFESDKHSVSAICSQCAEKLLIYDLALYPSASKAKGEETFRPVSETESSPKSVYIGYEYGELDDDQEFDQNDITWCQIFVEREGSLLKVFDDETA